jgi:HSP20 family protein
MCKVNSSLYTQRLAGSRREAGGQTHWVPNTDVYTTEEGLVIKVELAGMRREDLELVVERNRLLIAGQRPDGCRAPGIKFLVMEINYGSFECVIEVPAGYDLSQAKAAYQNGFLRVDVPLAAKPSSKPVVVPVTEVK